MVAKWREGIKKAEREGPNNLSRGAAHCEKISQTRKGGQTWKWGGVRDTLHIRGEQGSTQTA